MISKKYIKMTNKEIVARSIIGLLVVLSFVLLSVFCTISYSKNYAKFNDAPTSDNFVLDASKSDEATFIWLQVQGEWEFFYNKWIITDNYEGAADGTMQLPSRWSGKKINGQVLDPTGYASYRMTLRNLPKRNDLVANVYCADISHRIYANGELISEWGTLSKKYEDNRVDGVLREKRFSATGEDIEIVIEIGANKAGGLSDAMVIGTRATANFWADFFPLIVLGMGVSLLIFNIINSVTMFMTKESFSMTFLTILVFLIYFITKDFYYKVIRPFEGVLPIHLHIFTAVGFCVVNTYLYCHLILSKNIECSKTFKYGVPIFNIAVLAFKLSSLGTNAELAITIFSFLPFVYIFYKLCVASVEKKIKASKMFIVLAWLIAMLEIYIMLDSLSIIVYGTQAYGAIIIFLVLTVMNIIYFFRVREKAAMELTASELINETMLLKSEALRDQIKPHFIFNSLTSIQHCYHDSINMGDSSLTKFSNHLRMHIDAANNHIISFDKEIDNVINYFDLENLRLNNKLVLLFDVEFTGFSVPILSLQPLVENAIKHSGVCSKEDGYIQIRSCLENDEVMVQVEDNGKGFNTNNVRKNAVGLNNVTERLKYCIGATVQIESEIGVGTTITIKIPYKREGEQK